MAHITGGGLIDNPPRILPQGVALRIWKGSWPVPPLFQLIQRAGNIDLAEMVHVFNVGLGMLAVVSAEQAATALTVLGAGAWQVGDIVTSEANPYVLLV
jgi:phosphoribosylformylglycinamidine cyclo-ligase